MPRVTERQLQVVLTPDALEHETVVALLAKHYFPKRCVSFSTEEISSENDLLKRIESFAKTTLGEWTFENLRIHWEGPSATIRFVFDDRNMRLPFEQDSDSVNLEFYEQVGTFARENLSGDFIHVPTKRGSGLYVYLPREIAMEVVFLMMLGLQEYTNPDMMLDIFDVFQRHELLVNTVLLDKQLKTGIYDINSFLEALLTDDQIEMAPTVQHMLHYVKSTKRFGYVINEIAKLTQGEWKIENMTFSSSEQAQETTVQFDSFKHHFSWTLSWKPEGLPALYDHIQALAREYLSKDFAILPLDDEYEYGMYLYLPREAHQELDEILARGPLVGAERY
jgi:hypothetical protein